MCGFAGTVNLNRLEVSDDLDKKMSLALKSLYNRGPDQSGVYSDEYSYLVHARLSIIDITDNGKQPISKYGKTIVYNGEIYNYEQLKSQLQNYGYSFFSSSDTEVLLAAWDKWGENSLKYLNGMFAFAIWDKKNKNLTLVRDPYGKKPLLYSIKRDKIYFASDLNSLEKIANCGDINPLAVESLFKLRFIHDPLTIYQNAHKLAPGSILKFTKQKVITKKWYNLNNSLVIDNKNNIKKNIINLFDQAVDRRLVADVNIGVFLSGGLDSSLILSSLAEKGHSLPCFTMGFENSADYYEERPQARRLAKHFGMDHHAFEINENMTIRKLPEIFNACDEPFADTSAIPFYMLANKVSSKLKVVLSGDGGDEVFGGYRKHLGERWSNLPHLIPKFIRSFIVRSLIENKNTSYGEISRRIRRYLMNTSKNGSERQAGWLEQINENTVKGLLGSNLEYTRDLLEEYRKPFSDSINAMLAGDLGFSLSGDMLVKADRMSMANSLEVRSPFLDKDLVEYAFSIPGKLKIGNFKGKVLLKDTFKNRLPKWSMNLPKKGFELPIADWLRNDLKKLVDDSSSKKNLEKLGIINPSVIDNWKESLYTKKRDTSWQLWTLITYKQWMESRGKL